MTKYVLEILDGALKGTVVPLDKDRISIGRRPQNDLVLDDEKCSGEHAEIVFEDGAYVLRDLGSRNGTILDGAKIEEVAIAAFDVVQVGKTQMVFREEGQKMDTGDVTVTTIDASTMARRGGKRRMSMGTVAIIALLIVGGGAWGYLEFFAKEARRGGGGAAVKKPLVIPDNRLAAGIGDFEGDGGWVLASLESAGFELALGRAFANTGEGAIEAVYRSDDDGDAYRLALARVAEPIQVTAESKLRLSGFLATEGDAKIALRVRLVSSLDGSSMTTGTPLAAYDGYQPVGFELAVPRGMDQAEVQVLATLPSEGATARADDIGFVFDRELAIESVSMSTANGRLLTCAGSSVRVTTGETAIVYGVRPLVRDPLLLEIDRLGELVPSDVGLQLTVSPIEKDGFRFAFENLGARADGVVLDFPVASANPVVRAGEAGFRDQETSFEASVTDALLGNGDRRCWLRFSAPTKLRGRPGRGAFELTITGADSFDLITRFEAQAKAGREKMRLGARAMREGDYAAALDAISEVVHQLPHYGEVAREARSMRVELLQALSRRVGELRRDGAEARFFDARNGYQRVADGVEQLIAEYGERHVPQIDELRALEAQMREGLDALEREEGLEHRGTLTELAGALEDSGQTVLASAIKSYIERELEDN